MNNLNKRIKLTKYVYMFITTLIVVVGVFFSYLIAELNDAPGVIILGTTLSLGFAAAVYGIGEILLIQLQHINKK
ncbi:hypothetical protein [Mycoplasma sp. P36-A1]|uniref:hypothetical protein n=1 Tax=Mycoplasma sp. P36-A1 TaxID=3252900 RepID=UPI003C2F0545